MFVDTSLKQRLSSVGAKQIFKKQFRKHVAPTELKIVITNYYKLFAPTELITKQLIPNPIKH
jgi:hypothetical protein